MPQLVLSPPPNLSISKRQIRLLTSMFYVTLNNKYINYAIFTQLLGEFIILGDSARDVIGWHDSC